MARLIAIEGIDGSGKGTQARRLVDRLKQTGCRAALISFPRYEATFFGKAVAAFLNGKFGGLNEVSPFFASLLFALDRFESRPLLASALAESDVVVLDRYVASNVAHQAGRLEPAERDELRDSIHHVEYDLFQLPRPELTLLLDVSAVVAQRQIAGKPPRAYTDRPADIQEADADYLARVREVYLQLAETEPGWSVTRCESASGVRSIDDIADEVWRIVTDSV